jgi:hypothetical protein
MSLTILQKVNILFNRVIGNKSYTNDNLTFDEEQFHGREGIFLKDIWIDNVPVVNPLVSHVRYPLNGGIYPTENPIIYKYHKAVLAPVTTSRTNTSFYLEGLQNIIPSEYGDGTYQYQVWRKDVNGDYTINVPFGYNSWYFDNVTGILNFVNELPNGISATNPPAITCYKYVGRVGDPNSFGGGGLSADNVDNVTIEINSDNELQIKNKFKISSFYSESLSNNLEEVSNTWVITHNLGSIKTSAEFFKNDGSKKIRVNVPYEVTNNSVVTVFFNPAVRSGDFSVRITASY